MVYIDNDGIGHGVLCVCYMRRDQYHRCLEIRTLGVKEALEGIDLAATIFSEEREMMRCVIYPFARTIACF